MRQKIVLLSMFVVGLIVSAINPHDYFTWFLEVMPAIVGVIVLILTYRKFQFTDLAYYFILIHSIILFVGGHYTYAEVPAFDWIKELFHQTRNNYDKLGHFAQGFVPAIITRELLIRLEVLRKESWINYITIAICVCISVMYEFLEWGVAIFSGESADSFLGTQGYVWDTQSDMLYAAMGAIVMMLILSTYHNRQISLKQDVK